MKRSRRVPINDTLTIVRDLKRLPRERAPKTLLPAVMQRVGLADSYWRLETPIGALFVAHGPAGISMVSRARSASDFQRSFEKRFGRPIAPAAGAPPRNVRAVPGDRLRARKESGADPDPVSSRGSERRPSRQLLARRPPKQAHAAQVRRCPAGRPREARGGRRPLLRQLRRAVLLLSDVRRLRVARPGKQGPVRVVAGGSRRRIPAVRDVPPGCGRGVTGSSIDRAG
jgi:hypothetical protein